MKYEIGRIVFLKSGVSIYITGFDEKTKEYRGFNTDDNNPQIEITFKESDVLMVV